MWLSKGDRLNPIWPSVNIDNRRGCGKHKQTLPTPCARKTNQSRRWVTHPPWVLVKNYNPGFQTLAIRFATVDNAEAFKAAFLEARQYVLENQVDLDKN